MFSKEKLSILVAELLGTFVLSLVVYSIIARTAFPLFTGLAAAGVLAMLSLAFGKVSGAHANPAVTFGLWTVRRISTLRAISYISAQFLGALAAWALIKYFIGHSLTSLAGEEFDWKILIAEGLGAAIFVFGVVAALSQKFEGGKLAGAIGVSFVTGVVAASLASNGIINPAVAVGIQSWDWAYAVGPLVGALVGANLYALLFSKEKSSWNLNVSIPKPKVTSKKK